ncbi:MAG: Arm DNA-binding domain-containing protein, partial [Bacteroidales bacterium]|nr:Arm DNA-binding domain-containing protein [Bacteroidales bacterium]
MASIKAILYKGKKLSDGTYPVMLCLRKGAETKRFSLKFKASPKQWDDTAGLFRSDKRVNPDEILEIHDEKTNQIKTHKVGYKEKNALINRHLLNAQRIVAKFDDEKKDWTVSMFASEFSRRTTHVKFSDFIN